MLQEPQGASDHLKLPTTTMESVTEDQQKVEDIVPAESDSGLATNSILILLLSCMESLICLEGKLMTPHLGNTILFRSSQQLPRLRLGPSKGFLS